MICRYVYDLSLQQTPHTQITGSLFVIYKPKSQELFAWPSCTYMTLYKNIPT